jgi:alkylhydroperoxidase/carboxymuconolactone decarboxylase family protein YurZ
MSEKERDERIQALIERARRTREGRPPAWDYLIRTNPDLFEDYQKLYERGLLAGKELPTKYRELICMAILAFKGARDAVIGHGLRAYRLGATKQEVLDAAVTTLIPGGAPTFGTYLAALEAIEAEENKSKSAG